MKYLLAICIWFIGGKMVENLIPVGETPWIMLAGFILGLVSISVSNMLSDLWDM